MKNITRIIALIVLGLTMILQGTILYKRMLEASWMTKIFEAPIIEHLYQMGTLPLIGIFVATIIVYLILAFSHMLKDGF